MVVNHQIHAVELFAEIVGLHVDHGDTVEAGEVAGLDDLHLDVEQVLHAQVFGPRGALQRADDRGLLRAAKNVAQRQAARHRVGIGIVVEQNQHAIGVAEEPLILLHFEPSERAAEFDEQRLTEEIGDGEIVDLRKVNAELFLMFVRIALTDTNDIDERRARIADGFERFPHAALAGVFDDDAGGGGDVGFDVGIGAFRVARVDGQVGVVELPCKRFALDEKFDFEAGRQGLIEHPDEQLRLTNGETPHSI
jgi:hypothetical protein